MSQHLIFVYNANAGKINGLLDSVHKIMSPSTYECSLCAITHGVFTESKIWATYRKSSNVKMDFFHKDEFLSRYHSKWLPAFTFPIVLYSNQDGLSVFITTEELNALTEQEALIALIQERIK
ncbi:GTPase EngB [unidentified eubacterium SCB49]|nr:GTPase EngB [unidentified eubacterium SCB49]